MIEIRKDSQIVDVVVAAARKERIDSNVREEADKLIKSLASEPNPNNKYQIAQLVKFAVNDVIKRDTNWLDLIADTKRVGFGDKAEFDVKLPGVKAFIQAKGATTPRTKNSRKAFTMETLSVSARPFINIVELQNGLANAADLINDASYQMNVAINRHIEDVLSQAVVNWQAPYYNTGNGLVKATLDPMILHWIRTMGGATLLGDIELTNALMALTGATPTTNTNTQYSNDLLNEQNNNAFIGRYLGANVVNLTNPFAEDGTDDTVFRRTDLLYILPTSVDTGMRPLKVLFEGDVFSTEATNIDDLSWEIRLDQYFNAGIAYGDRPYMSVYRKQ